MPRRTALAAALSLALTFAACGDSTAPGGVLSTSDAEFLADALDAGAAGTLDDLFLAGGPVAAPAPALAVQWSSTTTFERVRDCPEGGTLTLAGTLDRAWDGEAGTYDVTGSGTKAVDGCAFSRRAVVITLNGVADWTHERHYAQRAPTGVWTTTLQGEFDWSKGTGEEGSCTLDLTRTLDVAAKTISLEGDFCGREISRTRSWGDA